MTGRAQPKKREPSLAIQPVPLRRRKFPKQERSKATVEAVLETTARILAREGYEGTTTNKIADESGYGVGSLYDYFPNKQALVAALIERHAEEMLMMVELPGTRRLLPTGRRRALLGGGCREDVFEEAHSV